MLAALLLIIAATSAVAQDATILDDRDAKAADPGRLQAEAELFETLRQGIALSIAECELTPGCKPTVSREELRRIVEKLESRLDTLTTRHSETADTALEPVLLAYVGARDGYKEFMTRVDAILPPDTEDTGTRVFEDAGDLPPEFAVFADSDAELTDDTGELPADAVPAESP